MPKLLVGIVNFTDSKMYAADKLQEMLRACVEPFADSIVVVGDTPVGDYDFAYLENPGAYADDMLMAGREWLREYAIAGFYEKMLWQGMDCFWDSKDDFEFTMNQDVPVVSALTTARDNADYAIARRFDNPDGEQYEIPDYELDKGGLVYSGFPGADAMFISSEVFPYPFAEGHVPWYRRVAEGRVNLCVEENWCLELIKRGVEIYVDADVRVHHVHEDGIARRWKGIEKPMSELSW